MISATIQSITKTCDGMQLSNQLVELDVSNMEQTSTDQVCKSLCYEQYLKQISNYNNVLTELSVIDSMRFNSKNWCFVKGCRCLI